MTDFTGKTIGQYQIVGLTQDTDSALVYKGFQPNMNRYVTVKVLKSQDPAAVQAFTQQNELLAQIQHPNILPIYDSGQAEGLAYRVMRFAEGGVLQDQLMQYYDPHKAAGLLFGVVSGLEKIHSQGLVHGNLEPGNIYLDKTGQPLLTDFGISKALGVPITPYMSFEQVQGGLVDKRSDVYALGVLLYELLTGGTPPAGTTVNLHASRPDVPQSVEQVILKAMAPNPDQRFQTPQQFGSALSNALLPAATQPAAAPVPAPTTAPPPVQQKSGTNWMGILLGGVVLVLIFLCAIVVIPKVIDALEEQSGEVVTEPPDDVVAEPTEIQVEIIVPTREPAELPTREPDEQPPEQAPPVDEQPPEQAPPDEDAPSAGQLPAAGDGGSQNGSSQICGSLGFASGFILLGSVFSFRRKKKS